MEHDKKRNETEIKIENFLKLAKEFMELQNQYNKFRIEEYIEWNETDCSCPKCTDATVKVSSEKNPNYCDLFKEEWR